MDLVFVSSDDYRKVLTTINYLVYHGHFHTLQTSILRIQKMMFRGLKVSFGSLLKMKSKIMCFKRAQGHILGVEVSEMLTSRYCGKNFWSSILNVVTKNL